VRDGETGLIAEACSEALALAMDRLWEDHDLATGLGEAGRARYNSLEISWRTVVERLVTCA
jgi:glycosyltransferase involved in cell wall biosynthesis